MDVLYFLKERTEFIRRYYDTASEPFQETLRKIEVGVFAGGFPIDSWLLQPIVYVSRERLYEAIEQVELLSAWLEEWMVAAKYK